MYSLYLQKNQNRLLVAGTRSSRVLIHDNFDLFLRQNGKYANTKKQESPANNKTDPPKLRRVGQLEGAPTFSRTGP